jgi:hypothetical protein
VEREIVARLFGAHGLYYFCGEKYDNNHADKCTKKPKPHLNALVVNDFDTQRTEETQSAGNVRYTVKKLSFVTKCHCRDWIFRLYENSSSSKKQVMLILIA